MKKIVFPLVLFVFVLFPLCADAPDYGKKLMLDAIDYFGNGKYNNALLHCRDVILDPGLEDLHADAYFWMAKSYLALNQLDEAAKNLEFYLLNYKSNDFYEEALYQKGRLLYLQGDYESSIQFFFQFQDIYPVSIFTANSYFWIAESLFSMGNLEDAYAIFSMIVKTFPTSFKVEAAAYRMKLIEQKDRENELLKLLKMSHEDNLKSLEDYQRREREYEQAISAYQKKIATLSSRPDTKINEIERLNAKIVELEVAYEQLSKEKQGAYRDSEDYLGQISDLEKELESQRQSIKLLQEQLEKAKEEGVDVENVEIPAYDGDELDNEMKLLKLKEEALELKEFYLNSLIEELE
ncbi:MAG: tetratricopeptide repeat protein [Spirochaetales bacterium]|nr:tetratricopeptide repeat protein [Spirochaetales bacterium]